MGIMRKALRAAITLLEDAIERAGDPGRMDLEAYFRERTTELLARVSDLEEDLDAAVTDLEREQVRERALDERCAELSQQNRDLVRHGGPLRADEIEAVRAGLRSILDDSPSGMKHCVVLDALLERSKGFASLPLGEHVSPALAACNCDERFRTAEDWRDHLPCPAVRGPEVHGPDGNQ